MNFHVVVRFIGSFYARKTFEMPRLDLISKQSCGNKSLITGTLANYEDVYREGQILAKFWPKRKQIKITSPAGTDLTAEIGHGRAIIKCE